ncbi:hypothetical protein PV326_010906 [Microctonus aethiopoides]|nr:hypothetical protein PV326_010906 [Microctonus aethiopoides]
MREVRGRSLHVLVDLPESVCLVPCACQLVEELLVGRKLTVSNVAFPLHPVLRSGSKDRALFSIGWVMWLERREEKREMSSVEILSHQDPDV